MNFIGSPEHVIALALGGRLSFSPLIDELTACDGLQRLVCYKEFLYFNALESMLVYIRVMYVISQLITIFFHFWSV
jgi:hypothetical protein